MIGRGIGFGFSTARDFIARGLVRMRVTPNMLTLLGMILTVGAGVCYAVGADKHFGWSLSPSAKSSAYLLLAGALLILSSACDMLDGAVARIGNCGTKFGAFLDSSVDRYSDFAVYVGIAVRYAWDAPSNITMILLSLMAFMNAFMISYTRARAEDIVGACETGYWQRGERSAAVLIATFSYNIPALLVQQAFLPALTVLRRVVHTKAVIEGKNPVTDPRQGNLWLKLKLWRWPRMTIPYDIVTGLNIAWLIFAPVPSTDVIRNWLS
jgi:phosphatidylglycerophosphate synthase